MSGTFYNDPNREALGLEPIWTGAGSVAEPPPEGEPSSGGDLPGDPGDFTIAQIQAWVDDRPHLAADVLAHERARGSSTRSTLVDWLTGFLDAHDGAGG